MLHGGEKCLLFPKKRNKVLPSLYLLTQIKIRIKADQSDQSDPIDKADQADQADQADPVAADPADPEQDPADQADPADPEQDPADPANLTDPYIEENESDSTCDEAELDASIDYTLYSLKKEIGKLKDDNNRLRKMNKRLLDIYNSKYKEEELHGWSAIKYALGVPNWTSILLSLVLVHTYKLIRDSNSEII